jgi:hypothetical protein
MSLAFQDRAAPCSASGVLNALRAQTPPRVTVTTTRSAFPVVPMTKQLLVSTSSAGGADGGRILTARAASLRSHSPALVRNECSTSCNRTVKGGDHVGYRLAHSPLLGRSSTTTVTSNYSSKTTGNSSTLVNIEYGVRAKSPVLGRASSSSTLPFPRPTTGFHSSARGDENDPPLMSFRARSPAKQKTSARYPHVYQVETASSALRTRSRSPNCSVPPASRQTMSSPTAFHQEAHVPLTRHTFKPTLPNRAAVLQSNRSFKLTLSVHGDATARAKKTVDSEFRSTSPQRHSSPIMPRPTASAVPRKPNDLRKK